MDPETYFERYGLSSWLYLHHSLEEALPRIARAGFRQVELWADQTHLDPRANPDLPAIEALLRRLGLEVHSVHLPFSGLDLGSPDESGLDGWLRLTGTALEYCAQLGGRVAVLHASGGKSALEGEALDRSRRLSAAFVRGAQALAGRLGIRLALENLLREWSQCGRSLAELAQTFPDDEIGFCLDTGHALVNGLDVAAEVRAAGSRLVAIHADDNDGREDRHLPPTRGVLDWQEVERCLATAGFDGCRMLEVYGGDDPDQVLQELATLWQRI